MSDGRKDTRQNKIPNILNIIISIQHVVCLFEIRVMNIILWLHQCKRLYFLIFYPKVAWNKFVLCNKAACCTLAYCDIYVTIVCVVIVYF